MRDRYAMLVRLQAHRNYGVRGATMTPLSGVSTRDRSAVGEVSGPLVFCSRCSKSGDNTLKWSRTWSGGDTTVFGRLEPGVLGVFRMPGFLSPKRCSSDEWWVISEAWVAGDRPALVRNAPRLMAVLSEGRERSL
jgi:hypothetical protein